MSLDSNTVAVRFKADCPKSLVEAAPLFSRFGDIARLDITVASMVIVTFFDVRDAQKVLEHFGVLAEPFPPAAHDFRAVSILPKATPGLRRQVAQLGSYGEIAGVSLFDGDFAVEFFDMRAAQQVTMSTSASRPRYLVSQAATQGLEDQSSKCPEPRRASAERVPEIASASSDPLPCKERRAPATPLSKGSTKRQGCGKPAHQKMGMEDRHKFDIMADKIRSGEDMRTTVMVRNIPGACSRDAFVELLETCGLSDSYTFFYMPFNKLGKHCGLAFIKFKKPSDVLVLCLSMSMTPFWQAYLKKGRISPSTLPAVSFARLQSQEELLEHFNDSVARTPSSTLNLDLNIKRPYFPLLIVSV